MFLYTLTLHLVPLPVQILGLEALLGSEDLWPVLLGLTVVPTVLQMSFLPFCPESPRFLYIVRCQEHQAKRGKGALFKRLSFIFSSSHPSHSSCLQVWGGWPADRRWATCWLRWRRRRGRWIWRGRCPSWSFFALQCTDSPSLFPSFCNSPSSCLGSMLWVFRVQSHPIPPSVILIILIVLSGQIFYYSTSIFMKAGVQSPVYATIGAGVVNCAFTVVSVSNTNIQSCFVVSLLLFNSIIREQIR